jgi:hypothetical protein
MIIKNDNYYVYKLLKEGSVVYVGKSTNIISRTYQHQVDKSKDFDSVDIIEVLKVDMSEMEFAYICRFCPKLNKDLPTIPYSVRETAARSYNKCISNNVVHTEGFDLKKPDYKVILGSSSHGLWAKKGEEDEFFAQMEHITKIVTAIK